MKRLVFLIIGVFLVVALGKIVFAQETPELIQDEEVLAQELGISEPKVLPDNPLYFFKGWLRELYLFFTLNPSKKVELRLKIANERLIEAKKLAELQKDPKLIEKTIADFQNEIGKIAKESGENLKQFSEKLIHQQILHQKILQRLETQVPPQVFEKIKANREKHLERFAEIMQKIEAKERIAERLEKEMAKIPGSKFRDFKNLEMLQEIKEKMPEETKKRIEEKTAQMIERLRENLEGMSDEEKEKLKTYLEKISGNKLKQLEIISNLEANEISEKLQEIIETVKTKKIEEIGKEEKEFSVNKVEIQIKKAEDEIKKAEEALGKISEEEYGGRAAKRLLALAKEHLESAKEAFDKKKYARAFGLATASYHEALNAQRIVEKIEEIKRSPEKKKEKFEKLYPGIELPKEIEKCEIPLLKKCVRPAALIVEKNEKGCPVFKCKPIEEEVFCPMVWDPVCGKDGKTYSNECFAKAAKVEIEKKGVCERKGEGAPVPERPRPFPFPERPRL